MEVGPSRKRRGVEVVLAEVILIAITVVAGVALISYSLGLFGSLSRVAEVSPVATHCYITNSTCAVAFANAGSAEASAVSCTLSGYTGRIIQTTPVVQAGKTASLSCEVSALTPSAGTVVYGRFTFSNGVPVSFVGVWD